MAKKRWELWDFRICDCGQHGYFFLTFKSKQKFSIEVGDKITGLCVLETLIDSDKLPDHQLEYLWERLANSPLPPDLFEVEPDLALKLEEWNSLHRKLVTCKLPVLDPIEFHGFKRETVVQPKR